MQSLNHRHTVYHFTGEDVDLSPIAEKLTGISISEMKKVFCNNFISNKIITFVANN